MDEVPHVLACLRLVVMTDLHRTLFRNQRGGVLRHGRMEDTSS
jgi:hypothetical protein